MLKMSLLEVVTRDLNVPKWKIHGALPQIWDPVQMPAQVEIRLLYPQGNYLLSTEHRIQRN